MTEDELRDFVAKMENMTLDDEARRFMLQSAADIGYERRVQARIDAARDPDKAERDAFRSEARAQGLLGEPLGITGAHDNYNAVLERSRQDPDRIVVVAVLCAARPCYKSRRSLALISRTCEGILFESIQDWHAATKAILEPEWPSNERMPEVTTETWLLLDVPHPDPSRRPWVTCPTHDRLEVPIAEARRLARSHPAGIAPARMKAYPPNLRSSVLKN